MTDWGMAVRSGSDGGGAAMWEQLEKNPFFSGGASLMVLGGAMALLRNLPMKVWGFILRRIMITVEVPDRDPAFRWLQSWVAQQSYTRRARNLSLTTTWEKTDPDDDGEYASSGKVSEARFLLSPAPGTHILWYRGRLLIFRRARRDLENGGTLAFQETLTLELIGGDRAMVEELLREAQKSALPKVPGVTILTSRYDSWYATSWRPRRPLASIVLADRMLEDLIADIREFLGAGSWYALRGVPHRRGYLLHGPPGNGKTSLVTAAAGELGLSVAVLSLHNKTMSDESLRTVVDSLPVGAMLLIEDVDCAFGPKRKTGDETGVTLSGLLNALDGVSSREGRILFLTTNHPERLDPALVRPGRVDRSLHLANTTPDQARRLFLWFYAGREDAPAEVANLAQAFADRVPEGRVCMAAIQEHLLRYRHDPEAAVTEADFEQLAEFTRRGDLVGMEPEEELIEVE
ncbi:MAG: AAA family ATPase [Isosphaeraceae bacterium]